jgi:hypothetical protein
MDRNEFYKEGNKVLTEEEYNELSGTFDNAEETCNDLVSDLRDAIINVMDILYNKRSSTELVTKSFTLINRIGDITITEHSEVIDGGGEISLDDINSVEKLMDIVAEMI